MWRRRTDGDDTNYEGQAGVGTIEEEKNILLAEEWNLRLLEHIEPTVVAFCLQISTTIIIASRLLQEEQKTNIIRKKHQMYFVQFRGGRHQHQLESKFEIMMPKQFSKNVRIITSTIILRSNSPFTSYFFCGHYTPSTITSLHTTIIHVIRRTAVDDEIKVFPNAWWTRSTKKNGEQTVLPLQKAGVFGIYFHNQTHTYERVQQDPYIGTPEFSDVKRLLVPRRYHEVNQKEGYTALWFMTCR